jgi:hypothetical protein
MSYQAEDLAVFEVICDKNNLDGTAYFELHQGELPEPLACWLDDSIFVRDAAFDFFVDCFHKADPNFDYFEFTRFEASRVEAAKFNLDEFRSRLVPGCSREAIFGSYSSIFAPKVWDSIETEPLRHMASRVADEISAYLIETQQKVLPLWVLGM